MQVNVDFCRTMQERMFPIGANLTQGNRAMFLSRRTGNRVARSVQIGDVGISGKEEQLTELTLLFNGQFDKSSSSIQYSRGPSLATAMQ